MDNEVHLGYCSWLDVLGGNGTGYTKLYMQFDIVHTSGVNRGLA